MRWNLVVAMGLMVGVPFTTNATENRAAAIGLEPVTVEPYVVYVTSDDVPVRCGDSTLYYPITLTKVADLLVVDGETTGWLRVRYPIGLKCWIKAEDVTEVGNGTVKLNKPSKVRAPNHNAPDKGAFFPVEPELAVGTELKVLSTQKDDMGKATAFGVVPPDGARGYISREAVRRATPKESESMLGASAKKIETTVVTVPAVPVVTTPPAPVVTMTEVKTTSVETHTPPVVVTQPVPAVTIAPAPTSTVVETHDMGVKVTDVTTTRTETTTISQPERRGESITITLPPPTVNMDTSAAKGLPSTFAPSALVIAQPPAPAPVPEVITKTVTVVDESAAARAAEMERKAAEADARTAAMQREMQSRIDAERAAHAAEIERTRREMEESARRVAAATPAPIAPPAPVVAPVPQPVVTPAPAVTPPAPVVTTQPTPVPGTIMVGDKDNPVTIQPGRAIAGDKEPITVGGVQVQPGRAIAGDKEPLTVGGVQPGRMLAGDKGDNPNIKTTAVGTVASGRTSMEALGAIYNRVRVQPLESAELEQAIAEFEKFKATLGPSQNDQRVAKMMQNYIDAMKMRVDLREAKKASASARASYELSSSSVGAQLAELEKQRVYTVIGRLVKSTVYDGNKVPMLYRVQSPEPGSARTLGYLLPDAKFDLTNKLEQVVGIIGEVRPDASLRTNLIIPTRVDAVSLAPISTPTPTSDPK